MNKTFSSILVLGLLFGGVAVAETILLNSFVNTKEDGKSVPVSNSILSDNFYNF